MFEGVDVNKLLEQDQKFRRYVAYASLELILADRKNRRALVSAIYGFYNIGLDMKAIREWAQSMQSFNDASSEEEK